MNHFKTTLCLTFLLIGLSILSFEEQVYSAGPVAKKILSKKPSERNIEKGVRQDNIRLLDRQVNTLADKRAEASQLHIDAQAAIGSMKKRLDRWQAEDAKVNRKDIPRKIVTTLGVFDAKGTLKKSKAIEKKAAQQVVASNEAYGNALNRRASVDQSPNDYGIRYDDLGTGITTESVALRKHQAWMRKNYNELRNAVLDTDNALAHKMVSRTGELFNYAAKVRNVVKENGRVTELNESRNLILNLLENDRKWLLGATKKSAEEHVVLTEAQNKLRALPMDQIIGKNVQRGPFPRRQMTVTEYVAVEHSLELADQLDAIAIKLFEQTLELFSDSTGTMNLFF